jgi:hypothetical protein
MGFTDIRDQHITGSSRESRFIFAQKFPFSLKDEDTDLSFELVGVDRELLPGLKVKVQYFEVGGIMDQKSLEGQIVKTIFFVKVDFFHEDFLLF